jgi:hypothetical protein
VAAAKRAGVKRLVYSSRLHPPGAALSPASRVAQGGWRDSARFGYRDVILQAGVVVGSGSASFEMIRHLTDACR